MPYIENDFTHLELVLLLEAVLAYQQHPSCIANDYTLLLRKLQEKTLGEKTAC